MHKTLTFPDKFVWGAAAASYQIEGAARVDDKGLSIWDMFTSQPGRIWESHTGDIACDHYNRFVEDVALMRRIGLKAYRMSISWPRVIPAGVGAVSDIGLGFYDRLVDELLANDIEPWITLFHWDFPYELFLRGGWLNPDAPKWFADYTSVVVDRLSDRVDHWMTLNEPQCFVGLGHMSGEHAPGLKLGVTEVLLAGHHAMMAHGMAVQTIRARTRKPATIGWAPVGVAYYPATEGKADTAAAIQAMDDVYPATVWNNRWWGDPVVFGHYPEQGLRAYGKSAPKFTSSDMNTISQPIDFYGANIYNATPVRADEHGNPVAVPMPPGHPHTHFLWNQTPQSLFWGTRHLANTYGLPIVVTENGMSNADWVSLDGNVHDPQRIDFLTRYLLALADAIDAGVDIRGYFQWSIMDNFEWAEGYKHRFGLIHVDYNTQKRTIKDSAQWYSEIIATNGASLLNDPTNMSQLGLNLTVSNAAARCKGRENGLISV